MGQNDAQLGTWSVLSRLLRIAGAVFESPRVHLLIIAVLIECDAPYAGFRVPKRGKTPMATWTLKGLHLRERTS